MAHRTPFSFDLQLASTVLPSHSGGNDVDEAPSGSPAVIVLALSVVPGSAAPLALDAPAAVAAGRLGAERYQPAIAHDFEHRGSLVVWHNTWGCGFRDIYAPEYDGNGNAIESSFRLANWTEDTTAPDIASPGPWPTEWLTTWQPTI